MRGTTTDFEHLKMGRRDLDTSGDTMVRTQILIAIFKGHQHPQVAQNGMKEDCGGDPRGKHVEESELLFNTTVMNPSRASTAPRTVFQL